MCNLDISKGIWNGCEYELKECQEDLNENV